MAAERAEDRVPPPHLVAEARRVPGGWVYEIDGAVDPTGVVPPDAIRGAWPVGPDGVIAGPFVANPSYRPRPGGAA